MQWGAEPVRIGQRQFFGQPTPFRVISRGQVPGLVAVKVELITDLEFQTSYISLHAFLKDLGLQWIARNRAVRILPQALLRRSLLSNPSVLAISTHNQQNPFTESQLLELENITRRGAAPGCILKELLAEG